MPKKSTKIQEIKKMFEQNPEINLSSNLEKIDISILKDLRCEIKNIDDYRDESYIKHNFVDIVMLALIAVMANADEWIEIESFGKCKRKWLEKFLCFPNGIPSHDTIQRVFAKLKPQQLTNICLNFFIKKFLELYELSQKVSDEEIELEKNIHSIDGKASNGSHKNKTSTAEIKALQSLNVFSSDYEMCIAQIFINEKTNEIPATRDVLDIIDVEGSIITCDALNTQKPTIEKIKGNGGDYVCALKGNQHNFFKDVELYFKDSDVIKNIKNDSNRFYQYSSKENGNLVTRKHYIENNIDWLYNKEKWKGLETIGLVHKIIKRPDGTTTEEKRYYICSITDVNEFARCTRGHWNVENKLHWQLDYTFKDDKNTTVEKTSAKNMQILKKIVLAILNLVKPIYKTSLKNIRKRLSWAFEDEIETIFKLLNVKELEKLLIK